MNDKVTYHQQVTYCGKPRCRKCRDGIGHGPYWYAYQTVDGQTTRTYIGKQLPAEVQATLDPIADNTAPHALSEPPSPTSLPEPSAPMLRILTLGQFRLERRTLVGATTWQMITDTAWQQRQNSHVRAVLGYLICCPERSASYAQIIADLWPEQDHETAGTFLNGAIKALRKILGHPPVGSGTVQETASWQFGTPLLFVDGERLSLAGQERIWLDADAFTDEATRLSKTLQTRTPEGMQQREEQLREVLAWYSGDFLPEEREAAWVMPRRLLLRHHWSTLLFELADAYTERSAFSEAIDLLDRLLAKEPTNELAVQRLIIVLARLKRRGEAFNAYKSFASALQREHQAVPTATTRELIELVRQGRELPAHLSVPTAPDKDAATSKALPPEIAVTGRSPGRDVLQEPIGRANQSPLVGRNEELELMRSLLADVGRNTHLHLVDQRKTSGIPLDTQRRPQCLLLMGDAGIGKTRLAEEMSREARQQGWTVVWSRLYAQESTVPYRVWTEILRKVLNMTAVPPSELDVDLLQPLISFLPELSERVPATLLEQVATPLLLEPREKQMRLWEAIEKLLKSISESAPLLIVLDDIQWADGSSHELLGRLARLLYGYPIIFVATCREAELPRRPLHPFLEIINHMQRERSIHLLRIEPLSSEQIGQLVAHLSALPDTMIKDIQKQADGNPFFAEELARSTPPALPTNVKAALDHRIGRLSKPCQQLLRNAAVLGGTFEFALICAMEAGGEAGDMDELADEDTVLTLLEEAQQAGVLSDEGSGTRILYHFWHPLLVNRLYELLSGMRRARLHLRAAEALQQLHHGREEAVATTITDHLIKGDAPAQQIAHYAELAGNRAYAVSAYVEAEQRYRQAVEYSEQAAQQTDHAHLASLLERLAECVVIRGSFDEAREYYKRVLELRRQGQTAALDTREAQIQALLLVEIGWLWSYTGDNADGWACCAQAERILREAAIVGGPGWARLYYLQASLYRKEGRYEEAFQRAQEALTLFEEQQEQLFARKHPARMRGATSIQRTLEGDPINLGRVHRLMAFIAHSMGQLSKVLEHQSKALALHEHFNEQRQIAHLSCDIGYIHIKKGEYELARMALQRSLALAERIGDDPLISLVYGDLGELAAANDDLAAAEEQYRLALDLAEGRTKDREYISTWCAGLATVLQTQGRFDEAAAYIWRAWSVGRAIRNDRCISLALVTLANLRIAQATTARSVARKRQQSSPVTPTEHTRLLNCAAADLRHALTLQHLEVETRTRGHLAQAHVAFLQGRREEAHTQIRQVIEEAQRYELALVEIQARQLEEQVNA